MPDSKRAYVGAWHSNEMKLAIEQRGFVRYERQSAGSRRTVEGSLKGFEGDNFSVGLWRFSTTFVVSKPPHLHEGKWQMTVDGVDLVKTE